jgi:polar amino acid transport system permease protein
MSELFDWTRIEGWIPFMVKGLSVTLLLAFLAALFGLLLGIFVVLMSRHKKTKWLAATYVDIFRGTPLLLQLSIVYFALPQVLEALFFMVGFEVDIQIGGLFAAILTFSLNSGAYISEIIRSGINSVDDGELEAARALGVSKFYIFKDIIWPTAFRNTFPSLMNELITLVKESSIVSVIGIQDLMRRQQIVSSQTFMYFEPLIVVGVIYYVVIKILSKVARRIEVKLAYD